MKTTDDVVQMTLLGNQEDDRAFAQRQRRSREANRAIKKIEHGPPPLPDGPCCGRCRAYDPPTVRGGFGQCQYLGITTMRSGEIPKGTVVDWKTAEGGAGGEAREPLNIKPWFEGCSGFLATGTKVRVA